MKRALLASTLLVASALAANATGIEVDVSSNGGAFVPFFGTDSLTITGQLFGSFNLNTIQVDSFPNASTLPTLLDTNTLNVSSAGAGGVTQTLAIDIKATGQPGPGALVGLTSNFDTVGLPTGWSVMETTFVNGVQQATDTFSSPPQNGGTFGLSSAFLGATFMTEADYLITTNGTNGDSNSGIEIQTVPGPILGAGLPGIAFGLIGLGWLLTRRKDGDEETAANIMAAA